MVSSCCGHVLLALPRSASTSDLEIDDGGWRRECLSVGTYSLGSK